MLYFIGCAVCMGLAVGILNYADSYSYDQKKEESIAVGAGVFLIVIAVIFGITGIVSLFV